MKYKYDNILTVIIITIYGLKNAPMCCTGTTSKRWLTSFMLIFLYMVIGQPLYAGENQAPVVEEILVTATRVEKNIRDIPASVEIIDTAVLADFNAMNVDELLKSIAGTDLQGSGFPGSEIKLSFRGLTPGYQSKRVLVLIDGRRFNDPYQGNAEFSVLSADNIEKIEIIKGPASALYGSNALGGVISIITKTGNTTPQTIVTGAGGSHRTYHAKLAHGWKKGALDYFITGSHVKTNGYINNADGTDRDFKAQNLTGNFGWKIHQDAELRLHLGSYFGKGTDEYSDRETRKDYEMLTYSLKWDPIKDAKLLVRLYRNGDHNDYDWKYPGKGDYRLSTRCGEIQQSFWLGERHLIVAGLENRRDDIDIDEVTNDIDRHTTVTAAYFQDEFHINEGLQLTVGIRVDYDEDYGKEFSPHLGLLWRLTPDSECYASVNRAHRAPGLSDRYVKVVYWGRLFEGNPDLTPETLTAYEIGYRCQPSEKLKFELTGFYNKMKDSFDFMLDPDGVFRNRNVTEIKTYGIEGSLKLHISDNMSGFINCSYIDGTYDTFPQNPVVEGNQLAYLAKKKAGIGLSFRYPAPFYHFILCRYVDRRYGDAQNSDQNQMDDHITADWRSRIQINKTLRLTINLDNLFNASYEEFPNLEQPGRRFLIGMEKLF